MNRRALRIAISAVLALDVLVLLAFSISRQTLTRTTAHPAPAAAPLIAAPAPAIPAATPTPMGALPAAPVPVVLAVPPPAASAAPDPATAPASSPSPSPTPSTRPTPSPNPTAPVAPAAACPVKITDAAPEAGGLQDLIDFAPAFGGFSAEAFAAAAAYQPMLELLGPILAKYPALAPKLAAYVTPFVSALGDATNALADLLGPIYTPYRPQVLAAESKLAAAIAPYAEKLAASPLGGCVTQLEAALVADTTPS